MSLLAAADTGQVTLITAGAGAGKTTLAAAWASESALPAAWVSLDKTDRDAVVFWSGVIAALRTLAPGCGARASAALRRASGAAAVADAVGDLLDDLDSREIPPSILVLDDLHIVDDVPEITAAFESFVEHLPCWLHLLLTSRRDPALPRDRLRARGRLAELRFAELRFSPAESREALHRLAPSMSGERIEAAAARADGWAAGLRLAALAARAASAQAGEDADADGRDPEGRAESADSPADDDRLVHDFVLGDVLAAESPQLLEFLSSIAVAVRVNQGLAEALTGRPDAHEYLANAESRGLFVSRLGADGWFQMHSLARSALMADVRSRAPQRLADQHARAAGWFERMGETAPALQHWVSAGRPEEALRLLAAETANLYDSGREATITQTIAAITPDIAATDLDSMIDFAWCHLLVDRRRFTEIVEQLDWWTTRSFPPPQQRIRVVMLQSMAATMNGRWVDGGVMAREALGSFGDGAWRDPYGRFAWNMVARQIALSERWDDSGDDVREAGLAMGRDPRRRVAFEASRALGEALAGRPVDALRIASGVRHATSVPQMTNLRAELGLAEALAHREMGERARAMEELAALADGSAEVMLFATVRAGLELVLAHVDAGALHAANAQFSRSQELVDAEGFGADGRDWIARTGTLLALANRDSDGARWFADQVADSFWGPISRARIQLIDGALAHAAASLERAAPRCVRHEVILSLLSARVADDNERAVKAAAIAVERAAAAGMVQTVASEGPAVIELVERAAWRAPASWLSRVRVAATPAVAHLDDLRLVEPLTERERDVLRFLPSRLTVREIADELFVSTNTLKFHLKVIYRKLGVSSRAEAADVARRLSAHPRQAS